MLSLNPQITNFIRRPRDGTQAPLFWSSFAVDTVQNSEDAEGQTEWRLHLPSGTPLGLGVVRFDTAQKMGRAMVVLIDPLPTAKERAGAAQRERANALFLHPPVAVEGVLEDTSPHYFQLALNAGESVNFEVVSQRLGYPLDSRLRVLAMTGEEIARADDSPPTGLDAALQFSSPRAETFWVELSDTRPPPHQPRPYRLRVGQFTPAPLAWLPTIHPIPGVLRRETVRTISGPSTMTDLASTDRPVRLEGTARPTGARDEFRFIARKDERLRVDLSDRRLGSAGDFTARFEDIRGRVLGEADSSKGDFTSLNFTFPAADTYRLVIEELTGAGGSGYDYQAELKISAPDFRLQVSDTILEGTPGGTVELKLKVLRRGYDGPIQLKVLGLPEGVEVTGGEIDDKGNDGSLKIKLPTVVESGPSRLLGVIGTAEIGGSRYEVNAETRTALRRQWMELNDPPPFLDGIVWLQVQPAP